MKDSLYYTLAKLTELISKTPEETVDKIILIGGQALIAWIHAFNINELTGEAYDNLASDDMDFMGSMVAVSECARCWNGHAIYPSINDSTIQTGRVILAQTNEAGEPQVVDFLGAAYGIPTEDVHKYSDKISIDNDSFYYVISPPLCLMSRIKNLTGYLRGENEKVKAREVSRIHSVITITRKYIEFLVEQDLQQGESRATKAVVNYLVKTILNDKDAKFVAVEYGIKFDGLFPRKIRSVNSDIYDKLVLISLARFNRKTEKKVRSRKTMRQQKLKKS